MPGPGVRGGGRGPPGSWQERSGAEREQPPRGCAQPFTAYPAQPQDPPRRCLGRLVKQGLFPPHPHSEDEEAQALLRRLTGTSYQVAPEAGCHGLSTYRPWELRCSGRQGAQKIGPPAAVGWGLLQGEGALRPPGTPAPPTVFRPLALAPRLPLLASPSL